MRTIIIGDIHGCYEEFMELLKKVHYKRKKDHLILLGDLMDRGPSSYEVLRWAIRWQDKNPDLFHMIRGNHEQMLVEQARELDTRLIWRVVGKPATLRSFRKHKDRMENYIPWILEHMPIYWEEDTFRCVHAGIEHEEFEKNSLGLLVKDHSWSKKNLYAGKLAIIGHTPLEAPTYYDGSGEAGQLLTYGECRDLPATGALCIDTGCVFGNKLTAMIIEDGKYCLEYVDSDTKVVNRAHFYVGIIRKVCALPIIRRFCAGTESR